MGGSRSTICYVLVVLLDKGSVALQQCKTNGLRTPELNSECSDFLPGDQVLELMLPLICIVETAHNGFRSSLDASALARTGFALFRAFARDYLVRLMSVLVFPLRPHKCLFGFCAK